MDNTKYKKTKRFIFSLPSKKTKKHKSKVHNKRPCRLGVRGSGFSDYFSISSIKFHDSFFRDQNVTKFLASAWNNSIEQTDTIVLNSDNTESRNNNNNKEYNLIQNNPKTDKQLFLTENGVKTQIVPKVVWARLKSDAKNGNPNLGNSVDIYVIMCLIKINNITDADKNYIITKAIKEKQDKKQILTDAKNNIRNGIQYLLDLLTETGEGKRRKEYIDLVKGNHNNKLKTLDKTHLEILKDPLSIDEMLSKKNTVYDFKYSLDDFKFDDIEDIVSLNEYDVNISNFFKEIKLKVNPNSQPSCANPTVPLVNPPTPTKQKKSLKKQKSSNNIVPRTKGKPQLNLLRSQSTSAISTLKNDSNVPSNGGTPNSSTPTDIDVMYQDFLKFIRDNIDDQDVVNLLCEVNEHNNGSPGDISFFKANKDEKKGLEWELVCRIIIKYILTPKNVNSEYNQTAKENYGINIDTIKYSFPPNCPEKPDESKSAEYPNRENLKEYIYNNFTYVKLDKEITHSYINHSEILNEIAGETGPSKRIYQRDLSNKGVIKLKRDKLKEIQHTFYKDYIEPNPNVFTGILPKYNSAKEYVDAYTDDYIDLFKLLIFIRKHIEYNRPETIETTSKTTSLHKCIIKKQSPEIHSILFDNLNWITKSSDFIKIINIEYIMKKIIHDFSTAGHLLINYKNKIIKKASEIKEKERNISDKILTLTLEIESLQKRLSKLSNINASPSFDFSKFIIDVSNPNRMQNTLLDEITDETELKLKSVTNETTKENKYQWIQNHPKRTDAELFLDEKIPIYKRDKFVVIRLYRDKDKIVYDFSIAEMIQSNPAVVPNKEQNATRLGIYTNPIHKYATDDSDKYINSALNQKLCSGFNTSELYTDIINNTALDSINKDPIKGVPLISGYNKTDGTNYNYKLIRNVNPPAAILTVE